MHPDSSAELAMFTTNLPAHPAAGLDSVRNLATASPTAIDRAGHNGTPPPTNVLVLRTITVIFRRDPSRDRQEEQVQFQGYQLLWPDGQPVAVGLDSFCRHGQRLLGLNRRLGDHPAALIELQCVDLPGREASLTRMPGCRVRRFFLKRSGPEGHLHFLDGTPTATTFQLDRDERRVLDWIGLPSLADGTCQWIDIVARVLEAADPR